MCCMCACCGIFLSACTDPWPSVYCMSAGRQCLSVCPGLYMYECEGTALLSRPICECWLKVSVCLSWPIRHMTVGWQCLYVFLGLLVSVGGPLSVCVCVCVCPVPEVSGRPQSEKSQGPEWRSPPRSGYCSMAETRVKLGPVSNCAPRPPSHVWWKSGCWINSHAAGLLWHSGLDHRQEVNRASSQLPGLQESLREW
jgi:hypothetical protein